MTRQLTAAAALLALSAFTPAARAQDTTATTPGTPTQPAPTEPAEPQAQHSPDAGAAAGESVDDMEKDVLGGKAPPSVQPPPGPRAEPRAAPLLSPPLPPRRRRRPAQASRDDEAAGAQGETALAIELGTSGFASGTLQGGLFLGARMSPDFILGGSLDFASTSVSVSQPMASATISSTSFRLAPGVRYTFVRASDGRVDLYGAGEAGVVYMSGDAVASGSTQSVSGSAFGFTLAAGPGLRIWIFDHLAIGYAALARLSHLSGQAAAFPDASQIDPSASASSTSFTLEGNFQILGVF
jgi:hypothetical protein